eukprot:1188645-Prorocentrum_minimum.AAC.10
MRDSVSLRVLRFRTEIRKARRLDDLTLDWTRHSIEQDATRLDKTLDWLRICPRATAGGADHSGRPGRRESAEGRRGRDDVATPRGGVHAARAGAPAGPRHARRRRVSAPPSRQGSTRTP